MYHYATTVLRSYKSEEPFFEGMRRTGSHPQSLSLLVDPFPVQALDLHLATPVRLDRGV